MDPICTCPVPARVRRGGGARGFTLLELLVTIAVAAVLLTVAVPSFRELSVRNRVSTATSEFANALAQARGLAIANNACATLCTASVSATGAPTCQAAGSSGFNGGWIVFINPACDAAQTDPTSAGAVLRQARNAGPDGFAIEATPDSVYRLMFDARGLSTAGADASFQIKAPDDAANAYTRTICLDGAGRATQRAYVASCS